jgi:hypothetical protein
MLAKQFFANLHVDPVQREQGIKCWTEKRLEKFQQGFPDAASWRNTALAFKQWAKSSPLKQKKSRAEDLRGVPLLKPADGNPTSRIRDNRRAG